jgi:hypothetical protein
MSDIEKLDIRLNDIDERTRRIEQKIFNGMSDALSALNKKLPELMTRDEHEAIEAAKVAMMREQGEKKDRILKLIGIILTFLGSGTAAGIIMLLLTMGE